MDDKPTDEELPKEPKKEFNKLDLSQLESFSFGTEWTKEKQAPGGGDRRRDDRPRRDGPRDDRKDRRGFKRSHTGGGGGGGGDRRGGGERRGGGDRRGQGGPGRDRRGGGDRRGGPPEQQGPYISPHFEATFYPEDVSFAALAKTIRASARTFELFDIAKTVIGKHDRFVVVLERKPGAETTPEGTKKPFYVCLLDGLPFESEEAVMNHITQKHLNRFFDISEKETEPPKGSFQVINKCGVTGELLGPPNYHLYNQIVQQHHATRLGRMDFERFSSRIESVRDPEVVEQWLESMKTVTRYTWLGDDKVPLKPESAEAETPEPVETPEAPAAAPESAEAAEALPSAEETAAPASESGPTEPEAPESSDPAATESAEAPADEPAAVEPAPEAESESAEPAEPAPADPVAPPQPWFDSVNEAKVHLITRARDKCVRTYERGRFHGRALSDMPDGEIKRAVLGALDRQQRFPLDTANALRGRLRREGFTIFKKGSKGVSYVSAVKRKFRVAGQTFADSINDLITFVENNPMVKVSELTEKFLGIVPAETAETKAEPPTATAPGTVSPFGEADQPRIKRMQLDLRWLVTEGYVTEFIDGSLFAAAPMPPPKKATPPAAKPAQKQVEPPAEPPIEPPPVTEIVAPLAAEPINEPAADEAPAATPSEATPESSPPVVEPVAETPVTETPAEPEAPAPAAPEAVPPAAESEPAVSAPSAPSTDKTPEKSDHDSAATEDTEEKPKA